MGFENIGKRVLFVLLLSAVDAKIKIFNHSQNSPPRPSMDGGNNLYTWAITSSIPGISKFNWAGY